ncbi:chalcone isomerase family protein [Ferrimonas pelagia]|uniref:Chalcone isomerase family protein n=1 Tax=Ferrimonas pelagia TaxID=1177826 RepID=A0ABP9FD74_9GAMM
MKTVSSWLAGVALSLFLVLGVSANTQLDSPSTAGRSDAGHSWMQWPSVGQARLKWGFWTLYDSELRAPDGEFLGVERDVALVIHYRRNIDRAALLQATDKQWQHLGIDGERRQRWLARLAQLWPDVRKGDRLIFAIESGQGRFYLERTLLGTIDDPQLSQQFLQIWLSPDTAYPKLRRQLLGHS